MGTDSTNFWAIFMTPSYFFEFTGSATCYASGASK
jgi:hypothetical protein